MTDQTGALTRSEQTRKWVRNVAPYVVLVVLYMSIAGFEPNFLRWESFRALLEQWPLILMLATGQMLVIMTGRIDLSIASLTSLAGMITVWGLEHLGGPLTVLVVLGMTTSIGVLQGLLHYHGQVASFVITLGGLGAWSGLALALFGGQSLIDSTNTLDWVFDRWLVIGSFDIPNAALIAVGIAVLVGLAMRYLPIGRQILAVGNGQLSAAYSGIKVGRVMAVVFGASGLFAGIGGLMIVGWIDAASPRTADNLLLPCIAAVVVGGTAITGGLGSIGRTVVGAMILAVLRVGLNVAGIEAKYQPIIYGTLIVIAVTATIDRSRMTIVK